MELNDLLADLKNNPTDAHAWVRLGRGLKQSGKVKEARESFERALYLDPSLEHVYEELMALEARDTLPDWVDHFEGGGGRPLAANARLLGLVAVLAVFVMLSGAAAYWISRPSVAGPLLLEPGNSSTLGQTRAEAVPLGGSLLLEEGLRVQVLKTFPDASDFQIRYGVDTNGDGDTDEYREDARPEGVHPYVVRLLVENVSGEEPTYLNFYTMSLSTSDGLIYDQDCGIIPEDLISELPLGEKTEGNICFLVDEDTETIEFLLYESFVGSQRRFFRLLP